MISHGMWLLAWGRVEHFFNLIVQVDFVSCLIKIHRAFSISYKILTNYVYDYFILIRLVSAVGTSFFFRTRFTSFHTGASLLTSSSVSLSYFILCCSHVRVFGTRVWVPYFLKPYWTVLAFSQTVKLQLSAQCVFGEKN